VPSVPRVNSIKTSPTQMTRDFRSIISGTIATETRGLAIKRAVLSAENALPSAKRRDLAMGWCAPGLMLYYNVTGKAHRAGTFSMSHHHHHGDAPHPSTAIPPSLLRLSAPQRIAVAGVLTALIWAAFFWATH
jgi:hypothetical protein